MGGVFVGRRRELEVLAEARVEATGGRRRLVVVRGAPGIGKTFLAEHAADAAERAGFRVVWGRCWPHGGAPPLWPWQPVLGELLGERGHSLLAGDPGDDGVDPERFARFAAIADQLRQAMHSRPLMLVLDDVHNADSGTLLLTRFICRTLDRAPLLMVLARRSAEPPDGTPVAGLLAELESEATVLPLASFDLRETIALLSAGGSADVEPATVITLTQVTGGNPLLLARAIAHGSGADSGNTVTHAIGAAIAALPSTVRGVLALAAVAGPQPTIAEIAAIAGDPADFIVEALRAAEERALVTVDRDAMHFQHDLIRDAALASLPPGERLDIDARVAAVLADDERVEARVRRAHHALSASPRSPQDAALAVDAARVAAEAMYRGFDYEGAAALLADATRVSRRLPRRPAWAALPVDLAKVVQACGRLAEARRLFAEAVALAEESGDRIQFARAAAGLGGVWLHEHRDPVDHQAMLAALRRARAALGDDEPALRSRLTVRLAAEAVYEGGPVAELRAALAEAREAGDGAVLAEALSLTHHALLAPGNGPELLAMSEELISAASSVGDGLLAVMGLMWRTVDLYQLGDPRAERSLAELRQRVDALGCRSIAYVVAAIDVMRLIRSGRLEEAESAAAAAFELGAEVGDDDATGYYAAHLLTIRFLQGRDAELLELAADVSTSPLVTARERGLRASVAGIAARAGAADQARAVLAGLRVEDIEPSSTSLAALMSLADAAKALGDADLARRVYDALAPYAELPITPSLAVTCLGSVERPLGHAAAASGDMALAVSHLERALAADERLGHRPMAAIAKAELAEALAAGDRPVARAVALLDAAAGEAETMDTPVRAAKWREQAAGLRRHAPEVVTCRIERAGRQWVASAGALRAEVPDLVGMRYLSILLDRPGQDIPATELAGALLADGARQGLVDERTLDSYRRRVRELDAEIDEADDDADLARAERLRMERDALREELSQVLGIGGRARRFADTAERARTSVHKAVRRALDAIAEAQPALGAALRASVHTGSICRYEPGSRGI